MNRMSRICHAHCPGDGAGFLIGIAAAAVVITAAVTAAAPAILTAATVLTVAAFAVLGASVLAATIVLIVRVHRRESASIRLAVAEQGKRRRPVASRSRPALQTTRVLEVTVNRDSRHTSNISAGSASATQEAPR
jgi:hypothetical protein